MSLAAAKADDVLVSGVHDRLRQDLDRIAFDAGIPASFVRCSATGLCGPAEIRWLRRFHFHAQDGKYGLVFDGVQEPPAQLRMFALCGALVRNFVHAQVRMLDEVLEEAKEARYGDAAALFIPDFYTGKKLPAWRAALLIALLYERMASGRQTIVSVYESETLRASLGPAVDDHLRAFFYRA